MAAWRHSEPEVPFRTTSTGPPGRARRSFLPCADILSSLFIGLLGLRVVIGNAGSVLGGNDLILSGLDGLNGTLDQVEVRRRARKSRAGHHVADDPLAVVILRDGVVRLAIGEVIISLGAVLIEIVLDELDVARERATACAPWARPT